VNLPFELFSLAWHLVATLCALGILGLAARRVAWAELMHSGPRLNAFLGFVVVMTLLWSMRAGVLPGLNLHLLGAMAACLLFGPWLAMFGMALVLCGIALNGAVEWSAWPINFIVMGAVPVLLAEGVRRLVERFLPSHFFVYVFVMAFAGSAIVVLLSGLFACTLLFAAGAYPWAHLANEYLPYFLLLAFSEAWISGAVITMMVVYRPEWVATFDDQRYLRR
jgi:uncharacterized membrane protein